MPTYLDFEAPLAELEGKIAELRALPTGDKTVSITDEVKGLEKKASKQLTDLYANLEPWQKAQVARHPERPHAVDYIGQLITEFSPMAGDRKFAEDFAVIGGLGRFQGQPVMVLGQEKGNDTASRLKRNFGMARPEGYRKAVRLMDMAERFNLPVLTFVDTAGAYPGIGAEERGQAEAIARSTERGLTLNVPMIATVTGEGGSGGAIALAGANRVLILEHSIYSVISPEGCASILWRDGTKAKDAAEAMKITAQDLIGLKIVDRIIQEPAGGAHSDPDVAIQLVGDAVEVELKLLMTLSPAELRKQRSERFYAIGRSGLA